MDEQANMRDRDAPHDRGHFGVHHHHLHLHGHERHRSRRALIGAAIILGAFLVIETVGGVLTNSLALLSDAAHLLTDVAAVLIALVAQWVAKRPPSARRSFGYRRVEIVAALFNGLTLWIVAIFICIEAVERFADPPDVRGGWVIAVAGAGAVAQGLAAFVLAKASGESLNVRGAYIHALTDAVQSLGVVASGIVILLSGFVLIDPIVSIVIGLMIIWSGGRVVVEAIHVLLEGTPPEVDLGRIAATLEDTAGVERVAVLHAWSLTTGYNALATHLVADEGLDAAAREEIGEGLSSRLRAEFPVHLVTVRVERRCSLEEDGGRAGWLDDHRGPPAAPRAATRRDRP